MTSQELPLQDALRFGWRTTLSHFLFWLGLFAIIFVISVLIQVAEYGAQEVSALLQINLGILGVVFQTLVNAGLIAVSLKFCDGVRPQGQDFICSGLTLLKFFSGYFLYGILVVFGLFLLIVPGVYLVLKFWPTVYLIVDKNKGPIEALQEAGDLTDGYKGQLFLFLLIFFAINLLGIMAFVVGLLVTIPLTMLASAYLYRAMVGNTPAIDSVPKTVPGVSPYAQK